VGTAQVVPTPTEPSPPVVAASTATVVPTASPTEQLPTQWRRQALVHQLAALDRAFAELAPGELVTLLGPRPSAHVVDLVRVARRTASGDVATRVAAYALKLTLFDRAGGAPELLGYSPVEDQLLGCVLELAPVLLDDNAPLSSVGPAAELLVQTTGDVSMAGRGSGPPRPLVLQGLSRLLVARLEGRLWDELRRTDSSDTLLGLAHQDLVWATEAMTTLGHPPTEELMGALRVRLADYRERLLQLRVASAFTEERLGCDGGGGATEGR
jgi:hypothetical protein